ncbi:MAG: galactose-1-phosphate uridylyltransferase [Desulfosarcinaceae bacterium]|nr:galactose-1-phosphate uridylyltransferase [Desulfosarcinaceae bacterium]
MLMFRKERRLAHIILPDGTAADRPVEIRTDPITGRTCRITFSRSAEREPGTETLPAPPPSALETAACPFCPQNLNTHTPRLPTEICPQGRLYRGESVLFPNLYPYGQYSAVSLMDTCHFVEIGTADAQRYADCFRNCRDYLCRIHAIDPKACHWAITQNHLPSAGGSLVHPHLQVQADAVASNYQRFLLARAKRYRHRHGEGLLSAYLRHEMRTSARWIGTTGRWQWLSAFAPEGFYEIWGILPGVTELRAVTSDDWQMLAQGILNSQKYYRSLGRNGYNLGLLFWGIDKCPVEVRVVLKVRANYAPWVRSDLTGFEMMLGDMATFTAPEAVAAAAKRFWSPST